MPSCQQVGRRVPERPQLIVEDLQGQPGVQLGIVDPPLFQPAVLVVLDQVVVRVAREGQRVQPESVHGGQLEQPQIGTHGFKVG